MQTIFSGMGIEIVKREEKFFIRYDGGQIVYQLRESEITEEEAVKAQKSEKDVYEVIIASQNREKKLKTSKGD